MPILYQLPKKTTLLDEFNFTYRTLYRDILLFNSGLSVFTALHGMQARSSDENSVCLSVRLSVRPSVCHTREL